MIRALVLVALLGVGAAVLKCKKCKDARGGELNAAPASASKWGVKLGANGADVCKEASRNQDCGADDDRCFIHEYHAYFKMDAGGPPTAVASKMQLESATLANDDLGYLVITEYGCGKKADDESAKCGTTVDTIHALFGASISDKATLIKDLFCSYKLYEGDNSNALQKSGTLNTQICALAIFGAIVRTLF